MALMSGFLGALASCLGKIALDPTSPVKSLPFLAEQALAECAIRGVFFVSMLVCNAYMLGAFLDGMEYSGSVAGTALSNAANFVSSAIIGYIVWQERFSRDWCIGFAFILLGTILLTTAGPQNTKSKEHNEKED